MQALRALGRHELVVFARRPEAFDGVEAICVTERPTLAWEQLGLPRAIRRYRLDAMLTWTERLPLPGKGRYLVWLFEPPTHRIRQNRLVGAGAYQYASDLVTLALWRRSLRRAAIVFTGSDATARAVEQAVPQTNVRTLYPGLEPEFRPGPGRDNGRYVLHLGSSDPRDDTETALAAFAAAQARLSRPATLVVAGGLGARADALRAQTGEQVEFRGRVSDEELVALYQGAAAYLDCSLYEGFGYQVLEAMSCATPVVASNVTSIPEIVGDAAVLCQPAAVAEFADALVRVLEDGELAVELRQRGLTRAGEFSWERTAVQLADAVDSLV